MTLTFYKYHGAGNDFIMVDNRMGSFNRTNHNLVQSLCHRRFGIGADGLMLVQDHPEYDFEMVYFNSDGKEGSMCGNGGRCIVAFAKFLGIIGDETTFLAMDGPHRAINLNEGWVKLQMGDVKEVERGEDYFYLNTGSPHYVKTESDLDSLNIIQEAHKIRYSQRFKEQGTNVNFLNITDNLLEVRTYERGVEDETYACGTGVVASAICAGILGGHDKNTFEINVKGGRLKVEYQYSPDKGYTDIWLEGGAVQVFKGEIVI